MISRRSFVSAISFVALCGACSSDDDSGDGTSGAGGDGSAAAGGAATGGSSGAATGGSGGTASGGASGSGSGGDSAGGSSSGGASGGGGTSAGGSAGSSGAAGGVGGGPNPDHDGIAARYPGDVGIEGDSEVIFADDFESYSQASDLNAVYDAVFQMNQIRFATEPANVHAGSQSIQLTVPQQDAELSNAVAKTVSPTLDVLYLRYYSKFDTPFDVVGSSHNGSSISAQYFDNGQATPGVPANGTNKFLANLENWRGDAATASPGELNVYIYHPNQRSQWGDHFFPDGTVLPNSSLPFDFGSDFVSRTNITPELDRWYCYELMVQANTPGSNDGRISGWLDGQLVMDFGNLHLRDIDTLKIDRFGLDFHIGSNPNGETHKWYDNVVAATSYIGPMVP